MSANRSVPTYEQPISKREMTQSVWYRYFQDLDNGVPHGGEVTVTVGASPFTYTAPLAGNLLVKGGTVSAVQLTRTATVLTGLTAGFFPLAAADQLTITYTGLPTMVFYPA